jgi:hypothetical protein
MSSFVAASWLNNGMAINTRVWTNAANTESGKFVEIVRDSNFPPTSATTDAAFGTPQTLEYSKYAVLTLDVGTNGVNGFPFGDNASTDAFGRLRVSNPKTLFDSKQIYNKQPQTFDEVINGSATSTHIAGDSLVEMSTTANNDYVIRQTPVHFNYQPGKSIIGNFSGIFNPETNIIKRIGLFQGLSAAPHTPSDGVFLESSNGVVSFRVIKAEGTTTSLSAAQSEWNLDKLDGSGASGLTIDFTKAQIIYIDYEWLGVGRVRCGFVLNGKVYYVHQFNNFNSLSAPYMTGSNQPVRYEIRQTGSGSGKLKHICSTVISEGGEDNVGTSMTAFLTSGISVGTSFRPIIAVRLNPINHDSTPVLKTVDIFNGGNTSIVYKIIKDPVITGGSLSYRNFESFNALQYAEGSASLGLSGGYDLNTNFATQGNSSNASGFNQTEIPGELLTLGTKINGEPTTLVIAARATSGTANPVFAAINLIMRG